MRNTKIDQEMTEKGNFEWDHHHAPEIEKADEPFHTPELDESLEKEKQEQKFVFQLIDHESGTRSDPFLTNWENLYITLLEFKENPELENFAIDDYILLVAILNGEETIVPRSPLITIEHFLKLQSKETH